MVVDASSLSSKWSGAYVHMQPDGGDSAAHQYWYLHSESQAIRTMQTDLCLTSNGILYDE